MVPRMEICETSGLPIPIVPRLHLINGYMKRKLCVWRAQTCNALVGAKTVLTSVERQTTPFHGGQYRATKVKACLRKFMSMDMVPPKQGHGDLEIGNNNNNYVPTSKVNFQMTRNTNSYWSALGGQAATLYTATINNTTTLYTTTINTECPTMWYK